MRLPGVVSSILAYVGPTGDRPLTIPMVRSQTGKYSRRTRYARREQPPGRLCGSRALV
jgi:hypothetical protein